ncbi:MAG: nucleoside hydrolase [Polyangiales bacterium]
MRLERSFNRRGLALSVWSFVACAGELDAEEELDGITQAAETQWSECSQEWQRCSFSGTRTVRYGIDGRYAPTREFTNGVDCRGSSFGMDPAPGLTKRCWTASAGTTPPTPPTTPPPTTQPPPSGGTSAHVPYTRSNPILYSNDHPEDVHTDVIMMALQSNGSINLRGIITDQQTSAPGGCSGDGCHTAATDDAKRKQWIEAARASGFQNVPSSVSGDQAVRLIISEAQAASASTPLVIIAGGPLMRIAEAYRRDPSIASKVIVALAGFHDFDGDGRYYGETNITGDPSASQTVLEKLRCVIVPFRDFNQRGLDQTRYPSTPRWRVEQLPSDPLRGLMLGIYVYPWAHYDADGGPTATLLSTSYATASKRVRWARDAGGPYLADDNASDDVLITSVNGGAATEAWWSEVTRAFAR